jgi:hypothetical protein
LISGPEKHQRGSLMEISWNATEPIDLPGGGKCTFLEDGDSPILCGWCQGDGYRVGFGEVEGTIVPPERRRRQFTAAPAECLESVRNARRCRRGYISDARAFRTEPAA